MRGSFVNKDVKALNKENDIVMIRYLFSVFFIINFLLVRLLKVI